MELKFNGSDSECAVRTLLHILRYECCCCEMFTVRTPHIGNPAFDRLTVCSRTYLVNLPITVCIDRQLLI